MIKYWYMRFIGECPVCGRDKGYRERRYTPRPENASERVTYLSDFDTYDHCEGI